MLVVEKSLGIQLETRISLYSIISKAGIYSTSLKHVGVLFFVPLCRSDSFWHFCLLLKVSSPLSNSPPLEEAGPLSEEIAHGVCFK